MTILDIIEKKRDKQELTKEEIEFFIEGYTKGIIMDYQAAALIMAIYLNGMTKQETTNLTLAMANSGEMLDLSKLNKIIVDKHSTGGVGDKVSLVLLPLVASCNVPVAKMSGRGLGFTGGTVDKLEAIPGYKTNIDIHNFVKNVENIGISMISQTLNLAPADKKIYALRDVTGTTESIPLIASSIMSKKIASGSKNLVLDIKIGEGALIKDIDSGRRLANLMIKIGKENDMKVVCLLTNMDIPLGNNIGNSLEVLEAINTLYYNPNNNLNKLCIELASYMVSLGLNINYEEAKEKVLESISSRKAYNKLLEFVSYQGGNINELPKSNYIYEVKSDREGCLTNIHSLEIAKLSSSLGSGRKNKEDKIDYSAGIIINKNINDKVNVGDTVLTLYTNREVPSIDKDKLFTIGNNINNDIKLIYEVIK